ncbi:hypothetical protein XENOCAPTIV_029777 [Xenoophorus captivus]|uniref:Mediator of RNA polymerase II transcription subunit 30 n=1 Tax=Xenoophorus captivus TaxID=1517983 RepID=A0ABV0RPD9_9TELE
MIRLCVIQLPNGVTQSHAVYQDRFGKLQEHLRQLALLFRKLRLLYERCVEMTSDLQEVPTEVRVELDLISVSSIFPIKTGQKEQVCADPCCSVSSARPICRRGAGFGPIGALQPGGHPGTTGGSGGERT